MQDFCCCLPSPSSLTLLDDPGRVRTCGAQIQRNNGGALYLSAAERYSCLGSAAYAIESKHRPTPAPRSSCCRLANLVAFLVGRCVVSGWKAAHGRSPIKAVCERIRFKILEKPFGKHPRIKLKSPMAPLNF